jgi:hypothetical protein
MILSAISLWKKFNLENPLGASEWGIEEKEGVWHSHVSFSGNAAPDGSVPAENLPVLQQLGQWLRDNGEAVYGEMRHGETLGGSCAFGVYGGTQLSRISAKGNTVYIWQLIWPQDGLLSFYGFLKPPKRIRILRTGEEVPFSFKDMRILLTGLPQETPDPIANIPVFALDFDEVPEYRHCGSTYHLDLF